MIAESPISVSDSKAFITVDTAIILQCDKQLAILSSHTMKIVKGKPQSEAESGFCVVFAFARRSPPFSDQRSAHQWPGAGIPGGQV